MTQDHDTMKPERIQIREVVEPCEQEGSERTES